MSACFGACLPLGAWKVSYGEVVMIPSVTASRMYGRRVLW